MGLILAVKSGNLKDVKLALKQGADVNEVDSKGWTPLHWAVSKKFEAMVEVLLAAKGIEIDAQNSFGETPLMSAISSNQESVAISLLQCGANPNLQNDDGLTCMHKAALVNNCSLISTMLDKYRGDISAVAKDGSTLMHCVAASITTNNDSWDLIEFLIPNMTEPNSKDNSDNTPYGILETTDPSYALSFAQMAGLNANYVE